MCYIGEGGTKACFPGLRFNPKTQKERAFTDTDTHKDPGLWKGHTYLCLFEAMFGREAPCAIQAVDAAVWGGGAQAVFGGRAGRKDWNCPRENGSLFPLGRWDKRWGQHRGNRLLLEGSVHQVHCLQGPEGKRCLKRSTRSRKGEGDRIMASKHDKQRARQEEEQKEMR